MRWVWGVSFLAVVQGSQQPAFDGQLEAIGLLNQSLSCCGVFIIGTKRPYTKKGGHCVV